MPSIIATKDAPKTIDELKELLKDDIKVKVAGAFGQTNQSTALILIFLGVDGTSLYISR